MVPLQLLISMFSDGVNSVKELANQRKSRVSELAGNLASRRVIIATFVLVLLLKILKTLVSYPKPESTVIRNQKCVFLPSRCVHLLSALNSHICLV